jgi:hypothetical protein
VGRAAHRSPLVFEDDALIQRASVETTTPELALDARLGGRKLRLFGSRRRGRFPGTSGMAEWPKAPDYESGERQRSGGSNPSPSARVPPQQLGGGASSRTLDGRAAPVTRWRRVAAYLKLDGQGAHRVQGLTGICPELS